MRLATKSTRKCLASTPICFEKPCRETYSRGETDELGGANPMTRNAEDRTPWDLVQENDALKGSAAYWRMNSRELVLGFPV